MGKCSIVDIVDGQKSVEFWVNFGNVGELLGSCSNTARGDNEAYERANGPMIIANIPTVFNRVERHAPKDVGLMLGQTLFHVNHAHSLKLTAREPLIDKWLEDEITIFGPGLF